MSKAKKEVAAAEEVIPVAETKEVSTDSIVKKAKKPVKWFIQEAIDKRKEK